MLDEYKAHPFFENPLLNRSIIVKHRLRNDERGAFVDGRSEATKVILPFNVEELKLGARYFFVGQIGYQSVLNEIFELTGTEVDHDTTLLNLLAALPSFDPFLMRERLKQQGFCPAQCYFEIAEADIRRMFEFARHEISALITISFNTARAESNMSARFAQKILGDSQSEDLEPLRLSLGLTREAFDEGLFCWKGFLYYKWVLLDLAPKIPAVAAQIRTIQPRGSVNVEDRTFIASRRRRLIKSLSLCCETVRQTLKIYDDAYRELTCNRRPDLFKAFLLQAPDLFNELGEQLGSVQHVISFWQYRFPPNTQIRISGEELIEMLSDFESSLSQVTLDVSDAWATGSQR
jgi:hypothetical protein